MDIQEWSPEQWSAIAAWVTVGVLMVTAVLALRQVNEARKLREEQTRPFVVADFDLYSAPYLILFTIENVGTTVARDVQFLFDPAPESTLKPGPLTESTLLRDGIPTLPPRKRIRTTFDAALGRFSSDLPMRYRIEVRYRDSRGKAFKDEYVLDLEFYRHLTVREGKDLHDLAGSLEKIAREVGKWTHGIHGIEVYEVDKWAHDRRTHRWMRLRSADDGASGFAGLTYKLRHLLTRLADRFKL